MQTERSYSRDRAWWLLKKLGESALEVADGLRREGVKGFRRHCHYCPLARFLALHGFHGAFIGGSFFNIGMPQDDNLPLGCVAFLVQMDDGQFPDLDQAINTEVLPDGTAPDPEAD